MQTILLTEGWLHWQPYGFAIIGNGSSSYRIGQSVQCL